MSSEALPTLISALLNRDGYLGSSLPGRVELIETHISWVLLSGAFAYKIKKPVCFGFLDFSSLDRRRLCCNEELRINRRYSSRLYLAVVPITGTPDAPRIAGTGPAIEYAVKMRRFPSDCLFDHLLSHQCLLPLHVTQLAEDLSAFHGSLPKDLETHHSIRLERSEQSVESNFSAIAPQLSDAADLAKLTILRDWSQQESRRLKGSLSARVEHGCIRECHGDLHLGNIVWLDDQAQFFDGIDFNADLRWIDTINEVAFPVMDLEVHGATELAYHFLNRYLALTGDYSGVELIDWFCLYRAMVRAKVAILRLNQTDDPAKRRECVDCYRRHFAYGLGLTARSEPHLVITHGYSGTGKSYLAAQLAAVLPAVWIRSDIERKRLFKMNQELNCDMEIYSPAMTLRTYQFLLTTADQLLKSRHSVILDGTFLKRSFRLDAARIAQAANAHFSVLDFHAPVRLIQNRIRQRIAEGVDPSDANETVLSLQISSEDPLEPEEMGYVISIDGLSPPNPGDLLDFINQRIKESR